MSLATGNSSKTSVANLSMCMPLYIGIVPLPRAFCNLHFPETCLHSSGPPIAQEHMSLRLKSLLTLVKQTALEFGSLKLTHKPRFRVKTG